MSDISHGLYRKYNVERTDGSSVFGGKHEKCFYFVLDVTHDIHSLPALKAYADSCRDQFPELAMDIDGLLS